MQYFLVWTIVHWHVHVCMTATGEVFPVYCDIKGNIKGNINGCTKYKTQNEIKKISDDQ